MGLMDFMVEILNEQEAKRGSGARWEALNTEPVELVETPGGIRYRNIRTGKFEKEAQYGRSE